MVNFILMSIGIFIGVVGLLFSWGFFFIWGMGFEKNRREKEQLQADNKAMNDALYDMADYYQIGGNEGV